MAYGNQLVKVRGLRELRDVLRKLPEKLAARVWKSAVMAGASLIRKAVRALAPRGRGHITLRSTRKRVGLRRWHLRDSIRVADVTNKRSKEYIRFRVLSDDPKAHLVEFGTKAHDVKAQTIHKLLRQTEDGNVSIMVLPGGKFIAGYKHPGAKAHPFMVPAFDGAALPAINAIAAKAEARIRALSLK